MIDLSQICAYLSRTYLAAPTAFSVTAYLVYYFYICIASLIVPAKIVKGHPNPKRGGQLIYSINGFRLTLLTFFLILTFGGIVPQLRHLTVFPISSLALEFWPLLATVNITALAISAFLYTKGRFGISILGEPVDRHSHGAFLSDFWIGRELTPRIGSFDFKLTALRVAMLFWIVLNLSFAALQIEETGTLTGRMWAYQISTCIYVLDYFWNEEKMLTTWDIISEEFGLMLVFGDYVFIPFFFSIQCHYLLQYPDFESPLVAIPLVLLFLVGYYIFRVSNSQKNQFRTDSSLPIWGKKPQTLGGRLLVSGFWGWGRHMNYTGDLIMAIGYCLPCGAQLGGYSYFIYLLILLTHRAYRDDAKCRKKYQKLWNEYNARVPYVFVPFEPIDAPLRWLGRTLHGNGSDSESTKEQ